jgi:hypothetical protein
MCADYRDAAFMASCWQAETKSEERAILKRCGVHGDYEVGFYNRLKEDYSNVNMTLAYIKKNTIIRNGKERIMR